MGSVPAVVPENLNSWILILKQPDEFRSLLRQSVLK